MKKIVFLIMFASLLFGANCEKSLLDLKIKKSGVRLSSIIEGIANDCGYSIFYENGGSGVERQMVSLLHLERKTPLEIIDFLLARYNFNYTLKDGSLTISKYATKTFKIDYLGIKRKGKSNTSVSISASSDSSSSERTGKSGSDIDSTEELDFWGSIEKDINSLVVRPEDGDSKEAKLIINKEGGFLTVTGTSKQLSRVGEYINNLLDRLTRQVLIDVKILEVNLNKEYTTGIDWSQFQLGFGFAGADTYSAKTGGGSNGLYSDINKYQEAAALVLPNDNRWNATQSNYAGKALLNFMKKYGDPSSLSNPKIIAMNGQPSLVSVGENINYLEESSNTSGAGSSSTTSSNKQAKDIFIGILLDITPQIDDSGYITLKINPSFSTYLHTEDKNYFGNSQVRLLPPDTKVQRISTIVKVKDGETIVLGGLISKSRGGNTNKVAILGDIPFLGQLFSSSMQNESSKELVFVLTPRLLKQNENLSLKDLNYKLVDDNNTNLDDQE